MTRFSGTKQPRGIDQQRISNVWSCGGLCSKVSFSPKPTAYSVFFTERLIGLVKSMRNQGQAISKYEVIIFCSEEDQVFIAEVPELPGYVAHGDAYESALNNATGALQLWIETDLEFGGTAPEPTGSQLMLA